MELSPLLLGALFPAASLAWGSGSNNKRDAILLSQVDTLTLRGNGAKTKHRRVPAVPQLQCVSSPSLCRLVDIDVMRCTNQGSSYSDEDVEWSCTANMPEEVKLGSTDVICEGYAHSEDPYVLKGSCAVEYRLALTSKGEQRYPDLASSESSFSSFWGPLLFIGVVILLIVGLSTFCPGDRNRRRTGRTTGGSRRGWGGGGGGGGGRPGGGGGGGFNPGFGGTYPNDPPPPYSAQPKTSSGSSSSQQQGWRPGFWSGLAAGAAGSYLASGSRNRYQDRDLYQNYRDYGGGPSNRFWGGRGSPPGGSGSGSASGSGRSHESTGFGSTRRR